MSFAEPPSFLICLSFALACGCLQGVSAQSTAPGVSFSPTVINFGQIPFGEHPTQLLTVTFSRPLFTPDHLPSLRLQGPNGPAILLFSRTVDPDAVTLVYRITFPDDDDYGFFRYQLVLAKEGEPDTSVIAPAAILDPGVSVQGERVLGLTGYPEVLDFGPVRYGKPAITEFHLGFSQSDMRRLGDYSKPPKHSSWSFSRSLSSLSVTSTSPYIAAIKKGEGGINASAWTDWKIVLSPKAPQKKMEAALTFQTDDGYFFTIPVTADLSGPGYPIAPWEPSKRQKH